MGSSSRVALRAGPEWYQTVLGLVGLRLWSKTMLVDEVDENRSIECTAEQANVGIECGLVWNASHGEMECEV